MRRHLLRTITVTLTITERWSVVYPETHPGDPAPVYTLARTVQRRSASTAAPPAQGPPAAPPHDSAE